MSDSSRIMVDAWIMAACAAADAYIIGTTIKQGELGWTLVFLALLICSLGLALIFRGRAQRQRVVEEKARQHEKWRER